MIGNIPAQNEWEANRLGRFTASKINTLLTQPATNKAKEAGELSKTAMTYILEKVTELATGTTRQVSTYATEWGNEYEPVAALRIKQQYPDFEYLGKDNPKFFEYSDFSGGSPDGYCPVSKLVGEVKCPENPANHTAYVMLKDQWDLQKCEPDYYGQIQFNMMCVAKEIGCDFSEMKGLFVSYCPLYGGVFEHLQYKEILLLPDMDFYNKITVALPRAEEVLADIYQELSSGAKAIQITGDTVNNVSVLIAE